MTGTDHAQQVTRRWGPSGAALLVAVLSVVGLGGFHAGRAQPGLQAVVSAQQDGAQPDPGNDWSPGSGSEDGGGNEW